MHHNSPKTFLHEPWRRHSTSTSKMVGFHLIRLISIPINKQELSGIQITQRSILLSLKNILPPEIHLKSDTENENYQAFSGSLLFRLVKDATIHSSTAPKSHVKLIPYMNIDNFFDLLFSVVFAVSTQLGVLVPKSQDLMIYFLLIELKSLP